MSQTSLDDRNVRVNEVAGGDNLVFVGRNFSSGKNRVKRLSASPGLQRVLELLYSGAERGNP